MVPEADGAGAPQMAENSALPQPPPIPLEPEEPPESARVLQAVTAPSLAEASQPLVLVLVGRVGTGKSSTANTILRQTPPFNARRSAAAVTKGCQVGRGTVGGRELLVIDTPGFGDAASNDEETCEEIRRGLDTFVPPEARVCLLLVLSFQARVGEEVLGMISSLEQLVFGPAMRKHAIVLWTHADLLEGGTADEYLQGADPSVQFALAAAKGGRALLDNRESERPIGVVPPQVLELLDLAASVAGPRQVAVRKAAGVGRKAARRQRQIEAGLLSEQQVSGHAGRASERQCAVS